MIEPGADYQIVALHSGKCLDVGGASSSDGAPVIQWDWCNGDNQKWQLRQVTRTVYALVARHSHSCVDIAGAALGDDAEAIQWHWWSGVNQTFELVTQPDGSQGIRAVHSGKFLTVRNGDKGNGAAVVQRGWTGGENQRWLLRQVSATPRPGLLYDITARHSGACVGFRHADVAAGAALTQLGSYDEGQRWQLSAIGAGRYVITAERSGRCLEVSGASTATGAPVVQGNFTGEGHQIWLLDGRPDGSHRIRAEHSGKCLDVGGSSLDHGAPVIQWDWCDGANQRWVLTQVLQTDDESCMSIPFMVVALHSDRVLEIKGAALDENATAVQGEWRNGAHQTWQLTVEGDRTYSFRAAHSGRSLSVLGADPGNGARAVQRAGTHAADQQWRLHPQLNDCFGARAKHSSRYLEVGGSELGVGAGVNQWDWCDGVNQKWRLVTAAGLVGDGEPDLTLRTTAAAVTKRVKAAGSPPGGNYYETPDDPTACGDGLRRLASGDIAGARRRLATFGFTVTAGLDPRACRADGGWGRRYALAVSEMGTNREWGLYLTDLTSPVSLVVAVPHTGYDVHCEQLGLMLWRLVPGAALLVSTVHRFTTWTNNDDGTTDKADEAHQDGSFFHHAACSVFGSSTVPQLQIHGYAKANHTDFPPGTLAVISAGNDKPTPLTTRLVQALADVGMPAIGGWHDDAGDLRATENAQGRAYRGPWAHLELEAALRSNDGSPPMDKIYPPRGETAMRAVARRVFG